MGKGFKIPLLFYVVLINLPGYHSQNHSDGILSLQSYWVWCIMLESND